MQIKTVNGIEFQKQGTSTWECVSIGNRNIGISIFATDGKYGVNWAACGTKTVEETELFILRLNAATKLAQQLNA